HATRVAALDAGASVGARLEGDLEAERARSTALGAELADVRTALELAQAKIREADRKALAEMLASTEATRKAVEAARKEVEEARKETEAAHKETGAARKEGETARKDADTAHRE